MVAYLFDALIVETAGLIVGMRTENPIPTVCGISSKIERIVTSI